MKKPFVIIAHSNPNITQIIIHEEVKDIDQLHQITYHMLKHIITYKIHFELTYLPDLFLPNIVIRDDEYRSSISFIRLRDLLKDLCNNLKRLIESNHKQPLLTITIS